MDNSSIENRALERLMAKTLSFHQLLSGLKEKAPEFPDEGFFHGALVYWRELQATAHIYEKHAHERNEAVAAYTFYEAVGDFSRAAKLFIKDLENTQLHNRDDMDREFIDAEVGTFLRQCGASLSDDDVKALIRVLKRFPD